MIVRLVKSANVAAPCAWPDLPSLAWASTWLAWPGSARHGWAILAWHDRQSALTIAAQPVIGCIAPDRTCGPWPVLRALLAASMNMCARYVGMAFSHQKQPSMGLKLMELHVIV